MLDRNVFFWKCHVPEDKTSPPHLCVLARQASYHTLYPQSLKTSLQWLLKNYKINQCRTHQSYMLDKDTLWSPFSWAVAAHTGHTLSYSQPFLSTIIPVFKIKGKQETVCTPVRLSSQIHESQIRTQVWWGQTTSIAIYLCISKSWVCLKQETKLRYWRKLKIHAQTQFFVSNNAGLEPFTILLLLSFYGPDRR